MKVYALIPKQWFSQEHTQVGCPFVTVNAGRYYLIHSRQMFFTQTWWRISARCTQL